MSKFRIVRDYPQPPEVVWRALTDPALIPLWTVTGQGARPEGFDTAVGTRFRFVAKPQIGWNGIVHCQVLEADEPTLLRYTWANEESDPPTYVTYRLQPHAGGTRFTYEHKGFTGVGGFFMARLLRAVRSKMLAVGLPAVLNGLGKQSPWL